MSARFLALVCAGALLASVAVNLGLAYRLCGGCPLCEQPSPAQVEQCLSCLDLTAEQCAALRADCGPRCTDAMDLERRISALRGELRDALRAAPVDDARVRDLGARLARLRGEAVQAGVEAALHLRSVLTPAQLAALDRSVAADSGK